MFVSKKKIKVFEERLSQVEEENSTLKIKVFSLEEKLANHKLYISKELSSVYEKLVEVQKELSRKITDDCEKQNLLKMIEDTREALDTSRDKLYGELLAMRDSKQKDDDENTIASIMDEYMNGGKEDE